MTAGTLQRARVAADYDGFLEFFFAQCFTEPHSTKQIEDCIGWAHETDPETLIRTVTTTGIDDRPALEALAARVRCPALVIHGTDDAVTGYRHGVDLSRASCAAAPRPSGRRPHPARARPGRGQPRAAGIRRVAAADDAATTR